MSTGKNDRVKRKRWYLLTPAAYLVDLGSTSRGVRLLRSVPTALAWRLGIVPLESEGETLTLAALDPDDVALADRLSGHLGRKVRLVAAESLQQMHDQAIEARTRLQLERATETQARADRLIEVRGAESTHLHLDAQRGLDGAGGDPVSTD